MAIYRTIKNNNYSVFHNGFIIDNRLSLKAKGLLAYFLSRPDNWKFYSNEILKNCKDGKSSLSGAIDELVKLGYIERSLSRKKNGKYSGGYDYTVYEMPAELDSPKYNNGKRENRKWEEPISENQPLINTETKINTKNRVSTKTPLNTKESGGENNKEIYTIFNEGGFGPLNNVVKKIIDENIEKYSRESVKNALIEAVKNNKCKLCYVEGILRKGGKGNGGSRGHYEEELRSDGLFLDVEKL